MYTLRQMYFRLYNDGKPYSKEFTVSGKAQEVTVELPAELLPITSEIVVDLYTGMPQIRYYNAESSPLYTKLYFHTCFGVAFNIATKAFFT